MIYESIADSNLYFYLIKSGTPFNTKQLYTIECPTHFHRNIEFIFVTKGEQQIQIDENLYTLQEGQFAFIDSFQAHSYQKNDSEAIILVLGESFFEPYFSFLNGKIFVSTFNDIDKNKEIFDFIAQWELDFRTSKNSFETSDLFCNSTALFSMIKNKYSLVERKNNPKTSLIISALKYIGENYMKNITLESCAKHIGYSKEYLSKEFNLIMNQSFKSHLNQVRIEKFISLSKTSKESKNTIAKKCGFNSAATFYRAQKNFNDNL